MSDAHWYKGQYTGSDHTVMLNLETPPPTHTHIHTKVPPPKTLKTLDPTHLAS
jgi:hypothetical protein